MLDLFKKKKYIFIVGAIILIAGGYYWYKKSNSEDSATQYKTTVAERGTLVTSVSGSGNVIVDQSATIDPTITGTVADLSVSVGDSVKKGDFLFNIVNDDLEIAAEKSYASYQSAVVSKKEAKNNYTTAKTKEKNNSHAYTETELNILKYKSDLAKEQEENAWADYLSAKEDADERKVVATIDGTVNAINIKNGDDLSRLSSNDSSEAPITLGDLSTLKAQVEVSEVDIASVSIGQEATLTFNAIDDFSVSGKVEKMDSLGTSSEGVVSYNVTIGFDSLDSRIKPQMTVSASIITDTRENVVMLQNSAVKVENGKYYVEVMKNGQVEKKDIEIGLEGTSKTEIKNGLVEGETVISQTLAASTASSSTSSSSNSKSSRGMGMPGF